MSRNGMLFLAHPTLTGCLRDKFGTYIQLRGKVSVYHFMTRIEEYERQHHASVTPEHEEFMSRLANSNTAELNNIVRRDIRAGFGALEHLKTLLDIPDLVAQGADMELFWNKLHEDCGKEELERGLEVMEELVEGVKAELEVLEIGGGTLAE